jgi:hypothetical protein
MGSEIFLMFLREKPSLQEITTERERERERERKFSLRGPL